MIVYGTQKDVHANGEAARRLQKGIAHPLVERDRADQGRQRGDREDDWKNHHILLVGRPASNSAVARAASKLPVTFGPASFTLKGETYAHAGTAIIVAGENPPLNALFRGPLRGTRSRVNLARRGTPRRPPRRGDPAGRGSLAPAGGSGDFREKGSCWELSREPRVRTAGPVAACSRTVW